MSERCQEKHERYSQREGKRVGSPIADLSHNGSVSAAEDRHGGEYVGGRPKGTRQAAGQHHHLGQNGEENRKMCPRVSEQCGPMWTQLYLSRISISLSINLVCNLIVLLQ